MTQLTTKKDIASWLYSHKIENYRINSDLSVDVEGHVGLNNKKMTCLPVEFNHVSGYFDCGSNFLVSLKNAPKIVGGNFNCSRNQLTSLEFGPECVNGDFNCGYNLLTSLEFSPRSLENCFFVARNRLTSLKGCPLIVKGGFTGTGNQINTLEFCPEHVGGDFSFYNNPGLGEFQYIKDFSIIRAEHLRIQAVLLEQQKLNDMLTPTTQSSNSLFKL